MCIAHNYDALWSNGKSHLRRLLFMYLRDPDGKLADSDPQFNVVLYLLLSMSVHCIFCLCVCPNPKPTQGGPKPIFLALSLNINMRDIHMVSWKTVIRD